MILPICVAQVFDDYLDKELFETIRDTFLKSDSTPWYHQKDISGFGEEKDGYFTQFTFADYEIQSDKFNVVLPLLSKIQVNALVRVKVNMYPRTDTLVHHKNHIDYDFNHKAALYCLNTCDGATVIGDQEVPSIENRMIIFDPQTPHHSTNCTNQQFRANININYF